MPRARKTASPQAAAEPTGGLALQEWFFRQMEPSQQFRALFEHLPGVIFFAKDTRGRMLAVSDTMVKRYGKSCEAEVIGKTDFDFFPPHIAEGFLRDDRMVMSTRRPLLGRLDVWFNEQRVFDWFVTNKLLYGRGGEVIGVMGTAYHLEEKREMLFTKARIGDAVRQMQEQSAEKLSIEELAQGAGLSERQFRRQFHDVFHMSPQEFFLKTRMQAACRALVRSGAQIAQIALQSGFSDQSTFTQHFRRLLGVTPLQFRREGAYNAKAPGSKSQ